MNKEEKKIEEKAKEFIKKNKSQIISKFADPVLYKPVEKPVSLFMAGSPGAGKTEVSRSLIRKFKDIPVRIDADEIRKICPGYGGEKAHLFQSAAVKGVNILFDHALHNNLNLILDGTFAYGLAIENIQRSTDRGRIVELWFVYQKPPLAWEFTKARETIESRHVWKSNFIKAFLKAKENTLMAKRHFGKSLEINLLIKNIDNSNGEVKFNIQVAELDRFFNDGYTEDQLNNLLK